MICIWHASCTIVGFKSDDTSTTVRLIPGTNWVDTETFEKVESSLKPFIERFKKDPASEHGLEVFKGKCVVKEKSADGKVIGKDAEKYLDIAELDEMNRSKCVLNIASEDMCATIKQHTANEAIGVALEKRAFEIKKELEARAEANRK